MPNTAKEVQLIIAAFDRDYPHRDKGQLFFVFEKVKLDLNILNQSQANPLDLTNSYLAWKNIEETIRLFEMTVLRFAADFTEFAEFSNRETFANLGRAKLIVTQIEQELYPEYLRNSLLELLSKAKDRVSAEKLASAVSAAFDNAKTGEDKIAALTKIVTQFTAGSSLALFGTTTAALKHELNRWLAIEQNSIDRLFVAPQAMKKLSANQ